MNKKILNLGCGTETYGDIRVDFVKTETTTHVCDLNKKLPFDNEIFDEVYSKSAFEHIKNLDNFISEIKRVLKKGGKFWIRTDNSSYIGFLFQNHQHYIRYDYASAEDFHYYLFKAEHLLNWFRDFKNLKISYTAPSKKLFFLPDKFKCMHIEISGEKK